MSANENRPTGNRTALKYLTESTPNCSVDSPQITVGARISQADDALGHVCDALDSGRLRLDELYLKSPNAARLYWRGWQDGYGSQDERVEQAERDANRMAIFAMNPADRAAEINARIDRALDAMPDEVEPHGSDYFERVLTGALAGGAA